MFLSLSIPVGPRIKPWQLPYKRQAKPGRFLNQQRKEKMLGLILVVSLGNAKLAESCADYSVFEGSQQLDLDSRYKYVIGCSDGGALYAWKRKKFVREFRIAKMAAITVHGNYFNEYAKTTVKIVSVGKGYCCICRLPGPKVPGIDPHAEQATAMVIK